MSDHDLPARDLALEAHALHAVPYHGQTCGAPFVDQRRERLGAEAIIDLDEIVAVRPGQPHRPSRRLRRRNDEVAVARRAVDREGREHPRPGHITPRHGSAGASDHRVGHLAHVERRGDPVRQHQRQLVTRRGVDVHVGEAGKQPCRPAAVDDARACRRIDPRCDGRDSTPLDQHRLAPQHALTVHRQDVHVDKKSRRRRFLRACGRYQDQGQENQGAKEKHAGPVPTPIADRREGSFPALPRRSSDDDLEE